jgi:hypothetical protein
VAALTKAELRARVLEHLGVVGAGQSAAAEDAALVDEAIDAAHDRLRKLGLAPFATSAIPSWAQVPLRNYVAVDVSPSFGVSVQRLPNGESPEQHAAERELGRQVAGYRHPIPIKADYY